MEIRNHIALGHFNPPVNVIAAAFFRFILLIPPDFYSALFTVQFPVEMALLYLWH